MSESNSNPQAKLIRGATILAMKGHEFDNPFGDMLTVLGIRLLFASVLLLYAGPSERWREPLLPHRVPPPRPSRPHRWRAT